MSCRTSFTVKWPGGEYFYKDLFCKDAVSTILNLAAESPKFTVEKAQVVYSRKLLELVPISSTIDLRTSSPERFVCILEAASCGDPTCEKSCGAWEKR